MSSGVSNRGAVSGVEPSVDAGTGTQVDGEGGLKLKGRSKKYCSLWEAGPGGSGGVRVSRPRASLGQLSLGESCKKKGLRGSSHSQSLDQRPEPGWSH